mmetsp:Transcript_20036/g.43288  ORF Transcript_20036/g.43288 Transcript_20036/m.43288 type:complete len:286 (+) Transcript_20036:85-942(+)
MVAAAAAPAGKGWKDLRNGAILQCAEAITLGMPFEVWKTRMGRFRDETTMQSLRHIYKANGLGGFWKGSGPKMIESASKGAVLLYAKEVINDGCANAGVGKTASGFLAGAGGGVCQTVVMGPCTFLVTAVVTGAQGNSVSAQAAKTWREKGVLGFYPGGIAIAFRQASNWASRQGFTEAVRGRLRLFFYNDSTAKLSLGQEALSGMIGGMLSCWNHPFEVARIEMQARAVAGEGYMSMTQVFSAVYAEYGLAGLFKGVIPRMGLNIWQTLFMVTGATLIKERLLK